MNANPLVKIQEFGQSIWLDFISKEILDNGTLKNMIDEVGLRGVTSNPKIFSKDIIEGDVYQNLIEKLSDQDKSAEEIYQAIAIEDVQRAADLFRKVYDNTEGKDGYVSLEVSPLLARKTEKSIREARMLWKAVDRPNIFIKIPGTKEGIPAIQQLISEGININVTLLFGLDRYQEVAQAYISGLENRLSEGKPIDKVASVASFFLSRIDVKVDPVLKQLEDSEQAVLARELYGRVAISEAKAAYQIFKAIFNTDRFKELAKKGAKVQRVLWASTSTKEDEFSDVKYLEELIGPDTVNTVPMDTLNAYLDHGDPDLRLETGLDESSYILDNIDRAGINLREVADELEDEGIQKFADPHHKILKSLEEQKEEYASEKHH